MYKVTVFILSSYKLDKNSAQNTYFVQNDRTVSRDSLEIRSDQKPEIQQSSCDFNEDDKKIFFFFFFFYIAKNENKRRIIFWQTRLRKWKGSALGASSEYHLG